MTNQIKTRKEIEDILVEKFGLEATVQVIHPKGEPRTLYQLEGISFNRRMTIGGLERLCRKIAKALDANIDGTVNIDFVSFGDNHTFDIMLEVLHD